jgi:two-component system phosphate regulon response regulator PhoB
MTVNTLASRKDHAANAAQKPLVLIVEDEGDLVTLLSYNLEKEGFRVITAGDGEEALLRATEAGPQLILLDWMLPLMSGLEVCRQLRRAPRTRDIPIIMLTARGEEADKVRGLNSGADDYLTKPFSPTELIARMNAVLRRAAPQSAEELLGFADLTMDLAAHRVRRGGHEIHLGPTEFRLLRHFLQNPGRVYSREQLLDTIWGHDVYVEPRTVDVHIRRLRKALNEYDDSYDIIRTVRSAGYALDSRDAL